MISLK